MNKFKFIHYFIALLLITNFIYAGSSMNGPTGLILIPTAESLKYKEFNISGHYLFSAGNSTASDYKYKINLGTFQNWEIGTVGGKTPEEGMYLNLKYHLMSNESELPLYIAIGAQNISSSDKTDLYMVASKKIRSDFGLHFGFKAIFGDTIKPYFMAGSNYFVNETLELMADFSPAVSIDGPENKYLISLGANYFISPHLSANLSLIDIASSSEIMLPDNSSIGGMRIAAGLTLSKFF